MAHKQRGTSSSPSTPAASPLTHRRHAVSGRAIAKAKTHILAAHRDLHPPSAADGSPLAAFRPITPQQSKRLAEHSTNHFLQTQSPEQEDFLSEKEPSAAAGGPLAKWGYLNVADYGAVADGATDDTAAFQKALTAGAGGKVFVPAGRYMLNASIVVPPYTVLEGVNAFPFSGYNGGSLLLTNSGKGNASAAPFIFLQGDDAGIKGLTIAYLDQHHDLATPVVYPPCIQGSGNNLAVENVLLANPYIAIDFATFSCPRHLISNVYGQPLSLGITFDKIYDIGRIRHVHFWPFWAGSGTPLETWVHTNGVTFRILRSDWEVIEDVFSWGYNRGLVFDRSPHGACNGQFSNIDFDDVNVGIEVLHTQPYGIMFSNLNLANAGNGDIKSAIRCPATGSGHVHMVVRGLVVWGEFHRGVEWHCAGKLGLSDSIFNHWKPADAAIDATAGRVNIHSNYFQDVIGTAVRIGSGVDRAMVVVNDLIGNAVQVNNTDNIVASNLP